MTALQVYAILRKQIRGLASGVRSAVVQGQTIIFTMNDGSTQTITFPTPADGQDGFSPIVDVRRNPTDDGAIISITDKDGLKEFEIKDGRDGQDGFSPTIEENAGNTINDYRLDITDKNGTITTPNLMGQSGKDGASVTNLELRQIGTETHLFCIITDADGNENEYDVGMLPNTGQAQIGYATKDVAGIIKVGDNLEIDADGILSAIADGNYEEILKQDYEQLTDDEKQDIIYFVKDDNEGGVIVTNDNHVEILKKDYDLLTEDERRDIVYFVTDDDVQVNVDGQPVDMSMYQLKSEIGELVDLETTEKTTVIGAINELNTDLNNKQDKITGNKGQLVGFNDDGTPIPIDMDFESNKQLYVIEGAPEGCIVDYREKEIRVLCPVGTQFDLQNVGATGDWNKYYITVKAYAPNTSIVKFKEDLKHPIVDQTIHEFGGDTTANGVDADGRKYSMYWLPVAEFDGANWTYLGAGSTTEKYLGWDYSVEWYDVNNVMINSDVIRINLTNEDCHSNIKPYYVSELNANSLPVGGTVGQVLAKKSEVDGDADWVDIDLENAIEISKADYDLIPEPERLDNVYYVYDEDDDNCYSKDEIDLKLNEVDSKSIKKVHLDEVNNIIRFYKDENADITTDGNFNITIPNDVDTSNLLEKLVNPTDGDVVIANADGSVSDGGVKLSDLATNTELENINTKIGSLANLNTTQKTDIVNAINEIENLLDNIQAGSTIAIEEDDINPDFAKIYTFKQNGIVIGTVNIPKSMIVQNGQIVEDPVGQPAGKYLEITLANDANDKIYINVVDLVDTYTAEQNAIQIQLAVSNTNEISASIVKNSITNNELANDSITTDKIVDANITANKLADDVKGLFDAFGSAALAEQNAKDYADALIQANPGNGGTVQTYTDEEVAEAVNNVLYGNVVDGEGGN